MPTTYQLRVPSSGETCSMPFSANINMPSSKQDERVKTIIISNQAPCIAVLIVHHHAFHVNHDHRCHHSLLIPLHTHTHTHSLSHTHTHTHTHQAAGNDRRQVWRLEGIATSNVVVCLCHRLLARPPVLFPDHLQDRVLRVRDCVFCALKPSAVFLVFFGGVGEKKGAQGMCCLCVCVCVCACVFC